MEASDASAVSLMVLMPCYFRLSMDETHALFTGPLRGFPFGVWAATLTLAQIPTLESRGPNGKRTEHQSGRGAP